MAELGWCTKGGGPTLVDLLLQTLRDTSRVADQGASVVADRVVYQGADVEWRMLGLT